MKPFLLLCLYLCLTACAPQSAAPASVPDDLPPNVADNARAIELKQTADAARYLAERASGQATDAARQQQQIEGKLTAVAQSTRDALSVRATTIAQDATATSVSADAQATAGARAGLQTATTRAEQNVRASTAQAALATDAALRVALTATRSAAEQTRVVQSATADAVALQVHATATRRAQIAAVEEAEMQAQRNNAGTREWLVNGFWLAAIAAVLALTLLGAFLLMRFWMAYEQNMRIVEKGGHLFIIESGNGWGGAPVYKQIDATPPVPQLLAPSAVSVSTDNALVSKRLDLAAQPHGLSIPLGVTAQGDKWLPLARAGHVLIGGPTGSGKTLFVHAIVQALLHRGMADLALYDGKQGLEFGRYAAEAHVVVLGDMELEKSLAGALDDMSKRYERMLAAGVRDIERYNLTTDDSLRRAVIVIDELKDIPAAALSQILSLMRMGRAAGIHVVLATQFPDAQSVPVDIRGNATTRVAFAVHTHHHSTAILGSPGAEKIEKIPGRALVETFGERIEVQTFVVDLPDAPVVTVAPAPFSEDEKKMIELALAAGGWFKVRQIARALGIGDAGVTATAEAWERRGWLSAEQSNVGRPGKNGRAVLPPLLDLAKRHGIAMSPMSPMSPQVAHVAMSPMSSTL